MMGITSVHSAAIALLANSMPAGFCEALLARK
jgi:hypothetical protein